MIRCTLPPVEDENRITSCQQPRGSLLVLLDVDTAPTERSPTLTDDDVNPRDEPYRGRGKVAYLHCFRNGEDDGSEDKSR
ncbi:hypothetical protein OUZ56_026891 [Daphnia magna]|uniref:Uncharacterized protein n=1 Tax=Daphnia magna TaxID=35525 RepID=A0ABQ9ZP61_9CRUS|nr:hypothetical protein OUZ56_026891 [Daphnia magna]